MLTMRKTSSEPLLVSDPVVEAVLLWLSELLTPVVLRNGVDGSCREVALSVKALGDGRLFGEGCVAFLGGRVGRCSPHGPSRLPCGVAGV
jgi:hypothetical protein